MRTMAIGEFRAKCLVVMAEVNATGHPVLVTKRGRPLARVFPLEGKTMKENPKTIFGCLQHMGEITEDLVLSEFKDEEWSRLFDKRWDRFEKGLKR